MIRALTEIAEALLLMQATAAAQLTHYTLGWVFGSMLGTFLAWRQNAKKR